jgi:hypothetical protein
MVGVVGTKQHRWGRHGRQVSRSKRRRWKGRCDMKEWETHGRDREMKGDDMTTKRGQVSGR